MAFGFVITATILIIAVIVELVAPIERVGWRSRAVGGSFILATMFSTVLFAYLLGGLWGWLGIRLPLPPVEQWAGWAALPITLLFSDFLKYWEHRFEHRFFWRVHCVHHAVNDLHAMTNYGHPLHSVPMFFLVAVPMSLLNFQGIATPLAATLLIGVLNAYSHSPVDFHFGALRYVLVDNRFHRIHHSVEPRHFDRNYGQLFSFWDTLFRTAHFPAHGEWPKVGVGGINEPKSLATFLLLPFRAG